nr:MAG TPA: hypothetical protein [Caudoviricetes sp.]
MQSCELCSNLSFNLMNSFLHGNHPKGCAVVRTLL